MSPVCLELIRRPDPRMYVCNCNGLRQSCVAQAIEEGARDADSVYAAHGCRMKCGRCRPEICQMLQVVASLESAARDAIAA